MLVLAMSGRAAGGGHVSLQKQSVASMSGWPVTSGNQDRIKHIGTPRAQGGHPWLKQYANQENKLGRRHRSGPSRAGMRHDEVDAETPSLSRSHRSLRLKPNRETLHCTLTYQTLLFCSFLF